MVSEEKSVSEVSRQAVRVLRERAPERGEVSLVTEFEVFVIVMSTETERE